MPGGIRCGEVRAKRLSAILGDTLCRQSLAGCLSFVALLTLTGSLSRSMREADVGHPKQNAQQDDKKIDNMVAVHARFRSSRSRLANDGPTRSEFACSPAFYALTG